jgi:SAM-dependent methyltransferase
VGENLLAISRQDANAIEIMNHDGLLGEFYEKCLGCPEAYHYLGELVSQLSHRYPNMNVLEIGKSIRFPNVDVPDSQPGAGTGGATKIVLPSLGESFDNFTFTDISSGFFEQAQRVFGHYEDRLDFKTLDITKKPGPQGFKEHSYDMVVAANVLHATPILADTLTNVRSLLKPGGHLLLLELTNLKSNRAGFIFGLFADWWAGQHEGRELAPFVPVERWDSLMSDNGFSSIDTRTADLDHDVFALSVFSARAVDSRTARLDAPLLTSATDSAPQIVVIGGKQDVLGGLVSSLRRTLSDRSFRIFGDLQDILDQSLKPNSTFLVLSELENELFAHLNEDKFESVKSVLFYARNVIWVTENAWTEHPHQAMLLGLLRTLRLENSDINFQSLDVDNIDALDASMLATQVVRLEAERGYRPEGILWTMEPELRLENGRLYAPRLTPDKVRNDRYNAARRSISTSANPSQATVAFRGNQTGGYFHAVKHSLLDKRVPDDQVRILVNRSSAQAIRVGNLGYFFLVDGQAIDSRAHVLALSESNASQVDVPTSRVVNIADDVNSDNFDLLAVAAELFADAVLSCAAPGSSMLVFEPYPFMLEPLLRRASRMKVEVTFAAADESHGASCPDSWLQLHEKDTVLSLAKAVPSRCSSFFDLSDAACPVSLANRLRSSLPAYCTKYKACHLYQEASFSLSVSSENLVGNLLADALNTASKQQAVSESVPATKLANQNCQIQSSTIIDWTNCNTLTTRVLPIDSADLFSREKTYLLVGLAGDLGRSLCLWMIQHGARHVVLTSRNPKVDQTWIDEMASLCAVVKVQSMYVDEDEPFILMRTLIEQECHTSRFDHIRSC